MQCRNTPGIFLFGIERDEIIGSGKALSLGFDGEIVGYVLLDLLAPGIAKLGQEEGMAINLLAAIAVESVSAKEI